MNLLKRTLALFGVRALKYAGIPLRDPALVDLFGIRGTQSGVSVDETTASNFSAYFSGVALISNIVSMLPIECCKRTAKGVEVQELHNGTKLFRDSPNKCMTPIVFKEMLQHDALSWGKGTAWIDRNGRFGPVNSLWPIYADQIKPEYDKKTGEKVWHFSAVPGSSEVDETYTDDEILHIPGLSYDGLTGKSIARIASESIGLGLAMEKFGASFFGNNAVPGGIVTHPTELSNVAKTKLEKEVEERLMGPYKTRRILVFDEGMKYTPIGVSPEDSQFIGSRQFQVREICRWLRVPPHMLYDFDGATFSNIENLGLEFLTYSLSPWLTRWTEELRKKMLTPKELEDGYFFRFNTSEMLRLDSKTRYEVYNTGRNMGLLTLNDMLRDEGKALLPSEIGDTHIIPSTMRTLGSADPSTPIPPDTFQLATAAFKELATKKPVIWNDARNIVNAMMPGLTTAGAESYLRILESAGYVRIQTNDKAETI